MDGLTGGGKSPPLQVDAWGQAPIEFPNSIKVQDDS